MHAYTVPILGVPAYGIPPDLSEGLRAAGREALQGALRQIKQTHPALHPSAELVDADPRPVLVDASAEAVLTVVGTRGNGRVPEVVLGSVALHVAAHGRSPVAVISSRAEKATGPTGAGTVLLGVDGSRTSEAAVEYAFDEADRRGATLDAVLVGTTPPCGDMPVRPRSVRYRIRKSMRCWPSSWPVGGTSIRTSSCGTSSCADGPLTR